jgi:hypothetical protein
MAMFRRTGAWHDVTTGYLETPLRGRNYQKRHYSAVALFVLYRAFDAKRHEENPDCGWGSYIP